MRPLRTTLAFLLLLAPALPAQAIPDTAARRAVGATATVVGTVVEVKDGAQHGYAYLNFGGRYPQHSFSVWIPDSAMQRFGDLQRFSGKRVRATGLVWLQNNEWPAMTLADPKALELIP